MTLEKIEEIRRKRIKTYHVLDFALDSARANEELHTTASYLYILKLDGSCSIRLNEISSDSIDLLKFRVISSPFYRFFLTHTAQAGKTLRLAIGVESEFFSLQDFQSPDLAVLTGYGLELRDTLSYLYGTQVAKNNVANGLVTVIIHTVTAGKTLILEGFNMSALAHSGGGVTALYVRDVADVTQYEIKSEHLTTGAHWVHENNFRASIGAGFDICLSNDGAGLKSYGFIKGREI